MSLYGESDGSVPQKSIEAAEWIDPWSLEYVRSDQSEQLTCPICQMVLVKPFSTKCGHTFCQKCIMSAYSSYDENLRNEERPTEFRCPVDRHILGKTDIRPAAFLITSLINDLEVKCPFSGRGCHFQDRRWMLDKHVERDCEFVKVICGGILEGKPCEDLALRRIVVRQRLKDDECVHISVECPNECGRTVTRGELYDHVEQCAGSVICEDCQETMSGALIDGHTEACPEGVIHCNAQKFGCMWSGKRSNLEEQDHHHEQCHLAALAPVLSRQDDRIELLEQENKVLRMNVERLSTVTNLYGLNDDNEAPTARSNANSTFTDSDLLHMFMECERLRRDVDHLNTTSNELYIKQGMMMMRENVRITEDISVLRAGFNSLRQQLHFLLSERRSHYYHHYYQSEGSSNAVNDERHASRLIGGEYGDGINCGIWLMGRFVATRR
jgi:hypothetical protein